MNQYEFMKLHKIIHKRFIEEGISKENFAFLGKIKASGRKLAILTSRSLQEIEHLLQKAHN